MGDVYPFLVQFAIDHPVPEDTTVKSWANECGLFIAESGRFIDPTFTITGNVTTAYQAWLSSLHGQVSAGPWTFCFFKNVSGGEPGHTGWIDDEGFLNSATTTGEGTLLTPGTPYLRRMTVPQYQAAHPERELVGYTNNYGGAVISPNIINPTQPLGDDMTDLLYYIDPSLGSTVTKVASGPNAGYTPQLNSMWYQECPGAPLFPLTANGSYSADAGLENEYGAYLHRYGFNGGQGTQNVTSATIALLIQRRGLAPQPIGNFGGSGSGANAAQVQAISDKSDATLGGAITSLATAVGQNTQTLATAITGVPAATVKAQGAALSNG